MCQTAFFFRHFPFWPFKGIIILSSTFAATKEQPANGGNMKNLARSIKAFFPFLMAAIFFAGCSLGRDDICYDENIYYNDNISETCRQQLKNCFGDAYALSDGIEKEEQFFNEFENVNVITRYTEWELTYEDAAGQECRFIFNNRIGRKPAKEHMEDSMESYFCNLVRQYYKQQFWDKAIMRIPGCRENDSTLYFQLYRLFSMPDVPETSTMFDERLNYSLSENICFPQLQYDAVFHDFPYILNMYLYVSYKSDDKAERSKQCRETEACLREMIDEMVKYTNHTLNATVSVTMMDEKGAAGGFSLFVLNGAYFESGRGIEYEIALHENFFGT